MNAIALNLHTIATNVLDEWVKGEHPYRAIIATAGNGNVRYFEDQEATLDLFKSLHGGLSLIEDLKLGRILGSGQGKARYQRGEAWRSGRVMRNIRLNLAALQDLYDNGGHAAFDDYLRTAADQADLADDLTARFTAARELAARIPDGVDALLDDPTQYARLEQMQQQVHDLREKVASELSVALGIPVGFNALDGD
jgi:predicted lipoprotein